MREKLVLVNLGARRIRPPGSFVRGNGRQAFFVEAGSRGIARRWGCVVGYMREADGLYRNDDPLVLL